MFTLEISLNIANLCNQSAARMLSLFGNIYTTLMLLVFHSWHLGFLGRGVVDFGKLRERETTDLRNIRTIYQWLIFLN